MLDYREKNDTGETRVYEYFVEGDRSKQGLVSLNVHDCICEVVKLAENDRFSRYANHLADALERFCKSGTLKATGTVMWY